MPPSSAAAVRSRRRGFGVKMPLQPHETDVTPATMTPLRAIYPNPLEPSGRAGGKAEMRRRGHTGVDLQPNKHPLALLSMGQLARCRTAVAKGPKVSRLKHTSGSAASRQGDQRRLEEEAAGWNRSQRLWPFLSASVPHKELGQWETAGLCWSSTRSRPRNWRWPRAIHALGHKIGSPGRIRTYNLAVNSRPLYH